MASIVNDPGGRRRIQFVDGQGSRKTIRLGKASQRAAEQVRWRVEKLLECTRLNHPLDADMTAWVAGLDDTLADKLARAGLIAPRSQPDEMTLGTLLDAYIAKRTDVKPTTAINWGHTRRNLLAFFGPDRPVDSITAGDAADFERWLRTGNARKNPYGDTEASKGLSPNTVRKRISNAKQFFQDAVERELLPRNPFANLKGSVGRNRSRDYFLSREDTAKILDACPDAQWRLIVALSRFGGIRCPSEHLALTWQDVDWARGRTLVS